MCTVSSAARSSVGQTPEHRNLLLPVMVRRRGSPTLWPSLSPPRGRDDRQGPGLCHGRLGAVGMLSLLIIPSVFPSVSTHRENVHDGSWHRRL